MTIAIEVVTSAESDAWADFAFEHNRRADGMVHCLHADQGTTAASHRAELRQLATDEHVLLAACETPGGRWVGVAGATHDATASRAWVRGPLLADDAPAALRIQLLDAVVHALPTTRRFDAFWQADESVAIDRVRNAGWVERAVYHVLEARRGSAPAMSASPDVCDAAPSDLDAAMRLQRAEFPNTYLPRDGLLRSLDRDHRLLVARDVNGAVAGYVYAQHRRQPDGFDDDGYVDFLAVEPSRRGEGWGCKLLHAATVWLLHERGVGPVSLTVQQDRAAALGLYFSSGFERVASGAALVFERP